MRLTFHGAARTVTGSQHLIEVNGMKILLDCGLFQGRRADAYQRNVRLPFEASEIDVMILSHAHIDHCGNIPNLVKSGFSGDIICTHATRDLCGTMLLDSGRIQERDIEYVNRKNRRRGDPEAQPIYTEEDAEHSLSYFTAQDYHRTRTIAPGLSLTFKDAGHMLGSTFVILDIEDQDARRDVRLVFSGDLGRKGIPIIRDPDVLDRADLLILESTYGDRLHPAYDDDAKEMRRIITDTYKRGGSVIIPAFAVGRTQQLIVTLHQLAVKGDIPDIPVFVDSPLAIDVTSVFRLHPEVFDRETRAFMLRDGTPLDPFGFDMLHYTRSTEASKKLNFMREPAVIISASGMAEAGRILHHLKNRIEDEKNTVLIVGFQAENTLGRRIADGEKEVRIFGDPYQVNAKVETLTGFSGHADRDELIGWVSGMDRKPSRTFLVHGETQPMIALAAGLKDHVGLADIQIPNLHQSFEV